MVMMTDRLFDWELSEKEGYYNPNGFFLVSGLPTGNLYPSRPDTRHQTLDKTTESEVPSPIISAQRLGFQTLMQPDCHGRWLRVNAVIRRHRIFKQLEVSSRNMDLLILRTGAKQADVKLARKEVLRGRIAVPWVVESIKPSPRQLRHAMTGRAASAVRVIVIGVGLYAAVVPDRCKFEAGGDHDSGSVCAVLTVDDATGPFGIRRAVTSLRNDREHRETARRNAGAFA
jgi:hypothetical protein